VTTELPHDVFNEDDLRITPDQWRYPRVVVMSQTHDGQWSWGELTDGGEVWDTTLTGKVLDQIERRVKLGICCGEVTIDNIPYQFVADRPKG
jgi:hypothetical protein